MGAHLGAVGGRLLEPQGPHHRGSARGRWRAAEVPAVLPTAEGEFGEYPLVHPAGELSEGAQSLHDLDDRLRQGGAPAAHRSVRLGHLRVRRGGPAVRLLEGPAIPVARDGQRTVGREQISPPLPARRPRIRRRPQPESGGLGQGAGSRVWTAVRCGKRGCGQDVPRSRDGASASPNQYVEGTPERRSVDNVGLRARRRGRRRAGLARVSRNKHVESSPGDRYAQRPRGCGHVR
jgi:hypothetical protein